MSPEKARVVRQEMASFDRALLAMDVYMGRQAQGASTTMKSYSFNPAAVHGRTISDCAAAAGSASPKQVSYIIRGEILDRLQSLPQRGVMGRTADRTATTDDGIRISRVPAIRSGRIPLDAVQTARHVDGSIVHGGSVAGIQALTQGVRLQEMGADVDAMASRSDKLCR